MIPFQLGFRNLIGILVPGAALALVIFTCLDILFGGIGQAIARETGNTTGPLVVGFLLTAYILGSVIRLWSADTVDQLSASRAKIRLDPFKNKEGSIEDHLKKLLKCVAKTDVTGKTDEPDNEYFAALLKCAQKSDRQGGQQEGASEPEVLPATTAPSDNAKSDPQEPTRSDSGSERKDGQEQPLIRWAWKYDEFPYPVWELMKLRLYHPGEVFEFFERYERCFATGYRRNKEFFNYCKAVIYEAHEGKRHALAEEVQSAEAYVRFFGGVFWALLLSALALVLTAMSLLLLGSWRGTIGLSDWLIACTLLDAVVLVCAVAAATVVWKTAQFVRQKGKVKWFWWISETAGVLLLISAGVGAFRPELATAARMNFVAFATLIVAFLIIAGGRFRLSRLKEVDTVFDAFFLVQRTTSASVAGP